MTYLPVAPAPLIVIPAPFIVIPAKAGIHPRQPDTAQWIVMKRLF
jgi:hypothetical protein